MRRAGVWRVREKLFGAGTLAGQLQAAAPPMHAAQPHRRGCCGLSLAAAVGCFTLKGHPPTQPTHCLALLLQRRIEERAVEAAASDNEEEQLELRRLGRRLATVHEELSLYQQLIDKFR